MTVSFGLVDTLDWFVTIVFGSHNTSVFESILLLHRTNPCRFFFSIEAIRAVTTALDFFATLIGLVRFCGTIFFIVTPVDDVDDAAVNRSLACLNRKYGELVVRCFIFGSCGEP